MSVAEILFASSFIYDENVKEQKSGSFISKLRKVMYFRRDAFSIFDVKTPRLKEISLTSSVSKIPEFFLYEANTEKLAISMFLYT
jgi:hypothetical protein